MGSSRGAYTYRLCQTYRSSKVLTRRRMVVLCKVNRDKYISGAAGKRRWGEKGAVGRESAREQFRLNT